MCDLDGKLLQLKGESFSRVHIDTGEEKKRIMRRRID
jgi:hypothetical protein